MLKYMIRLGQIVYGRAPSGTPVMEIEHSRKGVSGKGETRKRGRIVRVPRDGGFVSVCVVQGRET